MAQKWEDIEPNFDDDFDDDIEGFVETDPWEAEDRERLTQAVAMSHFRKPKTPLIRLLREAQMEVFKDYPKKIREVKQVPLWLSKKIKKETSPTEVMFLLVDVLVHQLESQGQTLELLFETMDAQADRIETLETEVRDRMTSVEDQLQRIRDRFNIEPPQIASKKPTQNRPVIAVVGLYPNQFSQVLDHCKRQNIDASLADLVPSPKDTWSLPDICHFAILSQWSGQGWDEIIRKRNKTQAQNLPITKVVHETKGLPMIAMKIGECIAKYTQLKA
jgi:hypothetical protein